MDSYSELRALLGTLDTEGVSEQFPDLDLMSTIDLVTAMIDDNRSVADAVAGETERIAEAVTGIAAGLSRGGRLIYTGAGTAGRMGVLDASEAPPTFGISPDIIVAMIAGGADAIHTAVENAEDDAQRGAEDLDTLAVGPNDSVVGISASGRTPYVVGALDRANALGAFTVAHSCNGSSLIGAAARVAIETVVGPEILAGSTRLKAGAAQKLVLNILSTSAMVRRGKVYRNLMVDLHATNAKLRARSERTVLLATGTTPEIASRTLSEVHGHVKAAILAILTGLAPEETIALLNRHDGFLRPALSEGLARVG